MALLDVTFTPADFQTLHARDLSATTCVVFDVLRATSTLIAALANGAAGVVPAASIGEALQLRAHHPGALLGGEREGLRITAAQSGGLEFDLGNSPREYTPSAVQGRMIISTTTNGTRALRACAGAARVLAASFANLRATADTLAANPPESLILVCGGTFEEAAYEDALCAGAMADLLWCRYAGAHVTDSAQIARLTWRAASGDLMGAMQAARNGRRLLALPQFRDDVEFCLRRDTSGIVAQLGADGVVRRA